MPKLKFVIDNNYTTFTGDPVAVKIVKEYLTILDPKRFFKRSYRNRIWDGKFVLYDKIANHFLSGLLPYVCGRIDKDVNGRMPNFISYEIEDKRLEIVPANMSWELPGVTLRDYQIEAIQSVINSPMKGRAVLHAAVNAGKTEIFAAIANYYGRKTLMITPNYSPLGIQTHERFKLRGLENVGLYRDNEEELEKDIVVCNIQLLATRKKKLKEFFKTIEVLLVDEVHAAESQSYQDVILSCPNAYIKVGMSGSPLRGDLYGDLILTGLLSHVIFKIKSKELIEKGYSSGMDVLLIDYQDPNRLIDYTSYLDLYKKKIVNNEYRNNFIVEATKSIIGFGDKVLIFTKSIDHCNNLTEMLQNAGIIAIKVDGSVGDRMSLKESFENGSIQCIVATTVFNFGIDFLGGVDCLINAASGTSEVAAIQKSGRGQRLQSRTNWNRCLMIDFIDKYEYFDMQSDSREKLYKREEYDIQHIKAEEFDDFLQRHYSEKIAWIEDNRNSLL